MGNCDNLNEQGRSPGTSSPQVVEELNNKSARKGGGPYIYDRLIIARINEYLHENKDQIYFDINDMVEALRKKYREYRRRPWGAFKKWVEKAFAKVSKNSDIPSDPGSSSEVEECNDEEVSLNSSVVLNKLYQSTQNSTVGEMDDTAELINLSSDEEPRMRILNNNPSVTIEKTTAESTPRVSVMENSTVSKRISDHPKLALKRTHYAGFNSVPKKVSTSESATVTFKDFAGNEKVLEEVCKMILHMKYPEVFRAMGVSAPRGFLLHGPPGSGKTLLANAIAGELKVPIFKVAGPELVAGISGQSEERVRQLFADALESAPCVIFIDEVDAVSPNRQMAKREMERRIVAQLITSLDALSNVPNGDQVLVIGATNLPDSLDPALRRAGRFDREVCLGIPDVKARESILRVLCSKLTQSQDLDFASLAQMSPGYVGADLLSLVREGAMLAITRAFNSILKSQTNRGKRRRLSDDGPKSKISTVEKQSIVPESSPVEVSEKPSEDETHNHVDDDKKDEIVVDVVEDEPKKTSEIDVEMDVIASDPEIDEPTHLGPPDLQVLCTWLRDKHTLTKHQLDQFCITQADLTSALKTVQPSAKREGFATVPDVSWDDVGTLSSVREHLIMTILGPIKYQEQFERLGLIAPAGVLLCGPPGCGKTLLAKAVANEAGINFISVKGPELLNMYVGESERAVRQVFQRAKNSSPCVIFFDELDALCPRRTGGDDAAALRVVNQMLTEMDGVGERRGVFLMAASNRPDIIDPAVLRPGRLDKTVYIGFPDAEDRIDILRALTKNKTKPPLSDDVCLKTLAARSELDPFTGADLAALVREAAMTAVREAIDAVPQPPVSSLDVNMSHFEAALRVIRPSVSPEDRIRYIEMKQRFSEEKS